MDLSCCHKRSSAHCLGGLHRGLSPSRRHPLSPHLKQHTRAAGPPSPRAAIASAKAKRRQVPRTAAASLCGCAPVTYRRNGSRNGCAPVTYRRNGSRDGCAPVTYPVPRHRDREAVAAIATTPTSPPSPSASTARAAVASTNAASALVTATSRHSFLRNEAHHPRLPRRCVLAAAKVGATARGRLRTRVARARVARTARRHVSR